MPSGDNSKEKGYSKEQLGIAKAYFEKIMSNSEEIGKMKLETFSIPIVERCRALYRENEKLFLEMLGEISK